MKSIKVFGLWPHKEMEQKFQSVVNVYDNMFGEVDLMVTVASTELTVLSVATSKPNKYNQVVQEVSFTHYHWVKGIPVEPFPVCDECNGNGENGFFVCPKCGGSGRIYQTSGYWSIVDRKPILSKIAVAMPYVILYQDVDPSQKVNNDFLRQGVVDVKCTFAGTVDEARTQFDNWQLEGIEQMENACGTGEGLRGIEVYANDAMNVFKIREGKVVGYFIYREDCSGGLENTN